MGEAEEGGEEMMKNKKAFIPWTGRLRGLEFRGLFFYLGIPPDEPVTLMFPKWATGWLSTQMNEYLFLGFFYLSWSM